MSAAVEIRQGCTWNDGTASWRLWAPNARSVSVRIVDAGGDSRLVSLDAVDGGNWEAVAECEVGAEYMFVLDTAEGQLERMDPCARAVTNSVGRCVVVDDDFRWDNPEFTAPPPNELVIYELHPATFAGTLDDVVQRLDHLVELGVNCVELMPVAEFAGDVSWGYNPALPYAVESAYGGPAALKRFVDAAHGHGIAVVLDVVYNHLGPSDLDLWRFDGWFEGDGGGIYFYSDWRAETPWGATRPDYGRGEVRRYLIDNARMWLRDYRIDGLRLDSTVNVRNAKGQDGPDGDIPEGWQFLAELTETIHDEFPDAVLIAEDLQKNREITRSPSDGGLGFDAQWAAGFVHPVRAILQSPADEDRDLGSVVAAIEAERPFSRVVYTESHDEVANGSTRVPAEIDGADPASWAALRRAAIGAVLVMTAPDIPMVFQGQEWADEDWFDDQKQLAWERRDERPGVVAMWRDLIRLRTGRDDRAGGLRGDQLAVHHVDHANGVIALLRWGVGGTDDAVLVVVNFFGEPSTAIVGVPAGGAWSAVFDSTWSGYGPTGSDSLTASIDSIEEAADGQPFRVEVTLDSYGAAIFTRHG